MPFFIFGVMMKSIINKLTLVSSFLLLCLYAKAQKVYDFDITCQQAYHEITSLKLNSGQQTINKARQQNPNNLVPELLESYIDFYELFFNEDPNEYKKRKDNFDDRLDKLDEGPANHPFHDFSRATVYLQKACVQIKFGGTFNAGWNFKKAFGLIKDNRKRFPSFTPNNLIYGPSLMIAGVIPDSYKWIAGFFGVKGSIKDGAAVMQGLVNGTDAWSRLYFEEACFYNCYLLFYLQNKPDEALKFMTQHKLDLVNNHLLGYMAANLAMNNKQSEYAKTVILSRNQSPEYTRMPYWDFEMGYIRMRHLEIPEAIKSFSSFLTTFKGKFYVKDACEKLAWCYYLQGNKAAAESTLKRVTQIGNTITDADKQANRDAKTGVFPNALLLKARVLNDGGYNNEAMAMLAGKSSNDFSAPEERLEFVYRLGRIYEDLGKNEEAIKAYNLTISQGQNRTEYFAARAALQAGIILEKEGKKDQAIIYYQKCLDMEDHEYKDSLDQKAKAGIARCKGN